MVNPFSLEQALVLTTLFCLDDIVDTGTNEWINLLLCLSAVCV